MMNSIPTSNDGFSNVVFDFAEKRAIHDGALNVAKRKLLSLEILSHGAGELDTPDKPPLASVDRSISRRRFEKKLGRISLPVTESSPVELAPETTVLGDEFLAGDAPIPDATVPITPIHQKNSIDWAARRSHDSSSAPEE